MTIAELILLHPLIFLSIFVICMGLIIGMVNNFTDDYKKQKDNYRELLQLSLDVLTGELHTDIWINKTTQILFMYGTNKDWEAFNKIAESKDQDSLLIFMNYIRKQLNLPKVSINQLAKIKICLS